MGQAEQKPGGGKSQTRRAAQLSFRRHGRESQEVSQKRIARRYPIDQPSSLAVQGWAYPWLANENEYLHGYSDWFRGGHVTQGKPMRSFPRILDKTSREEALSVSVIAGAMDHGSLELPGTVLSPHRDNSEHPPFRSDKGTGTFGSGWPHPSFLKDTSTVASSKFLF